MHSLAYDQSVAELRGVITDWGGVLSTPILTAVRAWIEADGIDWESYRAVMRPWVTQAYDINGSPNPVHALERGECSDAEFEEILAARLSTRSRLRSTDATSCSPTLAAPSALTPSRTAPPPTGRPCSA